MSIKYIKETYPEIYETVDNVALSWVFQNKKILKEKFTEKYQKSPFQFVVQVKTKRGSLLVADDGSIRPVNRVAYLRWNQIKKLGCPSKK